MEEKKNVSVTDTFQIWYWPYVFVVPLIAVSYYAWKDPGVSFRWPQSNVLLVILNVLPTIGRNTDCYSTSSTDLLFRLEKVRREICCETKESLGKKVLKSLLVRL